MKAVVECANATNATAGVEFTNRIVAYEEFYGAFGDLLMTSQIYLNQFIWGPETSFFRSVLNSYYAPDNPEIIAEFVQL